MKNNTFDKELVSNPRFFKENRLDAHSAHRYYGVGHKKSGFYEDSHDKPEIDHISKLNLNGNWKVKVVKNPSLIPEGFYREDFDISGFDSILVPGHIQIAGFDKNAYVNYQYPWDGVEDVKPGQIPTEYNPVACYVNYIDIDADTDEYNYRISFDGVESNIALWVNGQYVGYAEDAFTTSEFDITSYIRTGKNKIACQVYKWCASCFVDDQDFFRFSGIFRNVDLRITPKIHIEDIKVTTDLTDSYDEAKLNISLKIDGEVNEKRHIVFVGLYDAEYDINDTKAHELFPEDIRTKNTSAIANAILKADSFSDEHTVTLTVDNPKLWSAEKPNLYQLLFALAETDFDVTFEELAERVGNKEYSEIEFSKINIGFRKFEMKDGIMCINGKRIMFNGVNRHEFSMKTGRAISFEETEMDIINMKKNNINALRTSHYPNNEFVYDLCDKYGIYVICENNMESHGSWANIYSGMTTPEKIVPGDNPDFKELLLDRATSMIEKEKNHPSILIWSCGNESFGGSNIYELSQHMRKLDPTRLIHYEGIFHDRRYPDTSDMESQMYPSVEAIEEYLANNSEKPFICCEYTHAMGNSCGAMFKYTDLAKREARYQGGFIWDYIDQAIETKNIFGETYLGYGGDFGDRPCDYEFSGDGICYADRSDSPKMPSVKYNYQPATFRINVPKEDATLNDFVLELYVKNEHLFTSFSEYDFELVYERNGEHLLTKIDGLNSIKDLAPLEEDCISVGFDGIDVEADLPGVYTITLNIKYKKDTPYAKAGDTVAYYQYVKPVLENGQVEHEKEYTTAQNDSFRVIEGGYNVGVKGENFSLLFSALNGGLTSYVYNGKEYIDIVPRPNFWRAPTDNDRGNQMPYRYAQWKIASDYQIFKNPNDTAANPIRINKKKDSVDVIYTYYLATTPESNVVVCYSVYPDGKIKVSMDYKHVAGLIDMPEFGMLINLPYELQNVKWLGLGPVETYADRTEGAKWGKYENRVADNFAKYLRPQECGNKMDVYKASVTNDFGQGIVFEGDDMCFSALPYTPDDIECARHPYELKRSDHTVVRVSLAQMGVGGDDTWGARTHEEFLLPNDKDLHFEFTMKGI